MCVHVCNYLYTYIHTHTHTHTTGLYDPGFEEEIALFHSWPILCQLIHISICAYVCVCVCVCVYIYIYIYIHAYIYMHTHKTGLYDPGFEEEIAFFTFDEIYSWGASDLEVCAYMYAFMYACVCKRVETLQTHRFWHALAKRLHTYWSFCFQRVQRRFKRALLWQTFTRTNLAVFNAFTGVSSARVLKCLVKRLHTHALILLFSTRAQTL